MARTLRTAGCRPPRKGGTGLGKSTVRSKMETAQRRSRRLGASSMSRAPRGRATIQQRSGQKKAASVRRGQPGAKAKLMMKCSQSRLQVSGGVTWQSAPLGSTVTGRR